MATQNKKSKVINGEHESNLRNVARLLKNTSFCKLADTIESSIRENGYDFRLIFFGTHNDELTVYNNALKKDLQIEIRIEYTETDHQNDFPVRKIIFSYQIETSDINNKKYFSAWHLDTDINPPTEPALERSNHPFYHMHFGGKEMKNFLHNNNGAFEQLLLLNTPRLVHPPLDGILCIDFILQNFMSKIRNALLEKPEYRNALKHSQERIWKPYLKVLSTFWDTTNNKNHDAKKIWPHLICN